MRRKILRDLLSKQREQLQHFVALMRDEKQKQQDDPHEENENSESNSPKLLRADKSNSYDQKALKDLDSATKMLDLLDEFLGMQDYTLSQMGTFAQG